MGQDSFIKIPSNKKGIIIPFSIFAVLTGGFTFGREVYHWWAEKKAEIEAHAKEDMKTEQRLRALETWQCRNGWRPPETYDRNRDCSKKALDAKWEEDNQ